MSELNKAPMVRPTGSSRVRLPLTQPPSKPKKGSAWFPQRNLSSIRGARPKIPPESCLTVTCLGWELSQQSCWITDPTLRRTPKITTLMYSHQRESGLEEAPPQARTPSSRNWRLAKKIHWPLELILRKARKRAQHFKVMLASAFSAKPDWISSPLISRNR